ncbi:LOC108058740 [Sergentomyia squamirostris]
MPANQCKNCCCAKDLNNNHSPYSSGYGGVVNSVGGIGAANMIVQPTTHVRAKIMWGTVGAIKELREKEQAEKNRATRAERRQ